MNENNGKHVLFIATTLDGYIATLDDSLAWLFEVQGEGDNGYSDFIKDIDCVVLGRRTYDWIIRETGNEFPYLKQKCYVFTNKNDKLKYGESTNQDILSFSKEMSKKYKKIWIVGGGELIKEYMKLNIIDEYRITIAPVLLGNGIKLFHEIDNKIKLKLVDVVRMNQFVELRYMREES